MVVEKGRKVSKVAKDLGVSEPALRRWIKSIKGPQNATLLKLAQLEAENKRLKKELDYTKDTIEKLKKSLAIFVKPQNHQQLVRNMNL